MIDKFWCDGKNIIEIEPHNCPCCTKCWMVTRGLYTGRCVYLGPYKGYVHVREDDDPCSLP